MSLLSRLSLLQKFAVLALVGLFVAAWPTYLHVRDALRTIDHARMEASGAAPLTALSKVVQAMQIHRGLSAGMLGGDAVQVVGMRVSPRHAIEQPDTGGQQLRAEVTDLRHQYGQHVHGAAAMFLHQGADTLIERSHVRVAEEHRHQQRQAQGADQ